MRRFLAAFETLHFYGAAGIVSFGWALSRLLRFDCSRYAALWFAGALLVYNIDRLKRDPADAINLPGRSENSARLRRAGVFVATAAACGLVAIPLAMRDWLVFVLTVGGALVSINYSVRVCGFRMKDVPLLKTFFAPAVVAAACLALPLMQEGLHVSAAYFAIAAAWTFAFLFFNMTLCDLRDIGGDRAMGTLSVPVFLGRAGTMRLLIGLIAALAALALAAARVAPPDDAATWELLAIAAPVYLAGLLVVLKKPRAEWFYAWCVEGMLFLPTVILAGRNKL